MPLTPGRPSPPWILLSNSQGPRPPASGGGQGSAGRGGLGTLGTLGRPGAKELCPVSGRRLMAHPKQRQETNCLS